MSSSTVKQTFSYIISALVFLSLSIKINAQTNQNSTALQQQIMSAQQSAQAVENQLAPNKKKKNNHHGGKMKGMQKMSLAVAKQENISTQKSESKAKEKMKNMGGMGKQKMMGRKMSRSSNKVALANLPAFPGYRHIYHIGADGFFLDKTNLITLSEIQQQQLRALQNSWQSTNQNFENKINQTEQSLWLLTAEDVPDVTKIKTEIDQVSLLQAKQRLHFIQKVGEAATILSEKQRKTLATQYASSQLNN